VGTQEEVANPPGQQSNRPGMAKKLIGEDVSGCVGHASSPAEKLTCVSRKHGLKVLIEDATGKSRNDIKDSYVQELITENAEDAAWTANNSDKKEECKGVAEETGKGLNIREFRGRIESVLEDAAQAAVKEKKGLRDSGYGCHQVREVIARAKGKRADDISMLDEKATLRSAAKAALLQVGTACQQTREMNATATCERFDEQVLERTGKAPPKSNVEESADKLKVSLEIVETMIKDTLKTCFTGPKNDLKNCLQEAEEHRKQTVYFFLTAGGISDPANRRKKDKLAERKANIVIFGEIFRACMMEANTTRVDCKAQLKEMKDAAEVEGSEEDMLDAYDSFSLLREPIESCNESSETEMKDCYCDAEAQCLQSGMKRRNLMVMQKLAQIRASAEEWAGCFESLKVSDSDNVQECDDLARKKYNVHRGVFGKNFNMMLADITDLGKKIVDGIELKLHRKKEVEFHVKTKEMVCSDKVLDEIKSKTRDALNLGHDKAEEPDVSCEMVDDEPVYNVKAQVDLPDDEVQDIAENVSNDLAALSFPVHGLFGESGGEAGLLRRRAAEAGVTESFGAQSVSEDGDGHETPCSPHLK